MTNRFRPFIALASVALTVALLGAACGDDSEEADSSAGDTPEACVDVYEPADDAEPTGPDQIEDRGQPTMTACDPAVDELVVIDEVVGTGADVPAGATVTAHYAGISADTGTEFDSSWSRGDPATFPLDQVIPGWTEGLVGMKAGGRRTLVIPAAMAYGDSPPPGSGIAPGATLVFTIDLTEVS